MVTGGGGGGCRDGGREGFVRENGALGTSASSMLSYVNSDFDTFAILCLNKESQC